MLGESRNGALGLFASFKWKFHQQQKSDGLSVCAAMAANNFKVLGITANARTVVILADHLPAFREHYFVLQPQVRQIF